MIPQKSENLDLLNDENNNEHLWKREKLRKLLKLEFLYAVQNSDMAHWPSLTPLLVATFGLEVVPALQHMPW